MTDPCPHRSRTCPVPSYCPAACRYLVAGDQVQAVTVAGGVETPLVLMVQSSGRTMTAELTARRAIEISADLARAAAAHLAAGERRR